MSKLVRKMTSITECFTPTITRISRSGLVMAISTYDDKSVKVHLETYQVRDLARACIRVLDGLAADAAQLAQEARNP